jgi:hypothetical protein
MGISLDDLPNVAITLVLIAAIFVAGFLVLAGLKSGVTDADATAAINNVTKGMTNVVTYAPTWGTILGVAALLGIVLYGFMTLRGKQGGV